MAILTDDLLDRSHARAAGYDRDNAFFTEDLVELTEAGYLTALVPREYGGAGLSLREVGDEQGRPAGRAPAGWRGGGYSFPVTKIFASLSPAWTRLATFGLDTESDDAPKLVHAVVTRDSPGITVLNDWHTIGMRASPRH